MKNHLPFTCLLCWLFFCHAAPAQTTQGFVHDCATKESIIGATAYCKAQGLGSTTNEQGYFYLMLKDDQKDTIVVSYIGYKDHLIITIESNTPLQICLNKGIELEEVTVYSKGKERLNDRLNIVSIPIAQAMKLPTLLGEPDILKALQTKPGVTGGFEGSSGLFVRGGTPDQNLVLVDNNPVFNTGHALGFVSLFNGDAIKNMNLYKGYIPPKYGGRLSSVLDLQMKEGDQQTTRLNASIGLLSSRMLLSTPLVKNKVSFILNARSSYLGLVTYPQKFKFDENKSSEYQNYHMYDVNAKLHYKINDLNQISINQITAYDNYYKLERFGNQIQKVSNIWGSSSTSLRYNSILKKNIVFNLYGGINHYKSDISGGVLADASQNAALTSSIYNKTIKSEIDFTTKVHHLNTGVEYRHETLDPGTFTNEKGEQFLLYPNHLPLTTYSIFAEDKIRWSDHVTLRGGLRLNRYQGNYLDAIKPEARLEMSLYTRRDVAFRVAYNRMYQNVTLLANNGLSFPTDYWIPNGGLLPLSQA
ncbi:MAG: TonB-dependent receptor, partial [Saprospiraceae bacterium]